MRKIKLLLKIIAFSLTLILVVQILPLSIIATEINNNAVIEQSTIQNTTAISPEIIGEEEALRDEYTKHFRREDGSFVAAIYNEPVHYQENGEWKDVDNTIVVNNNAARTSSANNVKYTVTKTATPITFPENIKTGEITITNNNNIISFGVKNSDSNMASIASLSTPEELVSTSIASLQVEEATQVVEESDVELIADNQNSAITYDNVFENTSLEYEVSSSMIKESIVIAEKSDSYRYEFSVDFGSYIPIFDNLSGGIYIYETAQSEEPVMAIAPPYMFDADNDTSDAVTMELIQNATDYTLIVEADEG